MSMTSTTKSTRAFLGYRINFYYNTAHEKLIKFKHLLIIAIGLLIPSFTGLLNILKTPYAIVFTSESYSYIYVVSSLIIILIMHSTWIVWQRTAIKGGEVRFYFKTFPFSHRLWLISDMVMLIIANGLLWVPLLASAISPSSNKTVFYTKIFLLISLILYVQYKILHATAHFSSRTLSLRVALLWRTEKLSFFTKSIFNLIIIIFSYMITLYSQVTPLITTTVTIGAITYISSGWFKVFDDHHKQYKAYLQQFPHFFKRFYFYDLLFILSYNFLFELIFITLLIPHRIISIEIMGLVLILQIPLIVTLSLLETLLKNKAPIFSVMTLLYWIYLTTRILFLC